MQTEGSALQSNPKLYLSQPSGLVGRAKHLLQHKNVVSIHLVTKNRKAHPSCESVEDHSPYTQSKYRPYGVANLGYYERVVCDPSGHWRRCVNGASGLTEI
jgi:hypothetical protein